MTTSNRAAARVRRHIRVRKKVSGTSARPRLNVYRSLEHIYAQVIDDETGVTLLLNGSGNATLVLRDGPFRITPNTRHTVLLNGQPIDVQTDDQLVLTMEINGATSLSIRQP